MSKQQLRFRLAGLGVLAGVLMVAAFWRRSAPNQPLTPGSDRSQGRRQVPLAVSGRARSSLLGLGPGKILEYQAKGMADIRLKMGVGDAGKAMRMGLENIDLRFAIRRVPVTNSDCLVSIIPRHFKADILQQEGAAGGHSGPPIDDGLDLFAPYADSVLFKLTPEGVVDEIFVDPRSETARWTLGGYPNYLEMVSSIMTLFLPVGVPEDGREVRGVVRLLGVITMDAMFRSSGAGDSETLIHVRPTRILSFCGVPVTEPHVIGESNAFVAESSGLWTARAGYFESIRHRVAASSGTRIEASVSLVAVHDLNPSAGKVPSLRGMKRYGSVEDLTAAAGEMKTRIPLLEEARNLEGERLPDLLSRLDVLARDPLARSEYHGLLDKLERLLAVLPGKMDDFESQLRTAPPGDDLLFELMAVLSSPRVRTHPQAGRAALLALSFMREPSATADALLFLRNHPSDGVVAFLSAYSPKDADGDRARNAALKGIAEKFVLRGDGKRSNEILGYFFARLRAEARPPDSLVSPFRIDSPLLRDFAADRWAEGADRKAALQLVAVAAFAPTAPDPRLSEILGAGLFATFSDAEILDQVLPLMDQGWNLGFLEFLREKAPSAALRNAAELRLKVRQDRERVSPPK